MLGGSELPHRVIECVNGGTVVIALASEENITQSFPCDYYLVDNGSVLVSRAQHRIGGAVRGCGEKI